MVMTNIVRILLTLLFLHNNVYASTEHEEGGNDFIFHHIADDRKYTFFEVNFRGKEYKPTIYPPTILIKNYRFYIFSSKNFYDEDGNTKHYNGFYIGDDNKIKSEDGAFVIDISITKNVLAIFFSAILLIVIFYICGLWYLIFKSTKAPKGFVGAIECVFLYMLDDVIKPNVGSRYKEYTPYLMTLFFFILINNLLGLLPGAANVTGDISVTACLAFITFLYTNLNLNKHYWGHVFKPDVPKFLYPIMIPIEFISLFTKPFTLLIRLFANMTSGHIILLSIINLGFMFQSYFAGTCGIFINTFMIILKIVVAFLQAYIFTLLSAIYIGGATNEE